MSVVTYTDQLDRKIELPHTPQRIISIVPSQTELLYHLGLQDEVVGITKFCIHPDTWFRTKARVGGTKQLHLDKIRELRPDLILANKEENDEQQIGELCAECPVWISDIQTIEDALEMIRSVGEITNRPSQAAQLIEEIESARNRNQAKEARTAAYLIWNDPWMTVNDDTFIHAMMEAAGMENVFAKRLESRYPQVSLEELRNAGPEVILLSSEPFPFEEKHATFFRDHLPQSEVLLVDGEMFSWYGSRMVRAFDYFAQLNSRA